MKGQPVILIFDVGKTNKKVLLFDEHYKLVHEETCQLQETKDEDNFPCEDIDALTQWISESLTKILLDDRYDLKAVNFSGYGASFVYLDKNGTPVLPIYNYLKPFPEDLLERFYTTHGGNQLCVETASPRLGSLNSGLQLYRIKYENPKKFASIHYALHLPQYLSYVTTKIAGTDITSIGCHTHLWDFNQNTYHGWAIAEDLISKFPPIVPSDSCAEVSYNNRSLKVGIGLHDSSAALIPYLASFKDPFVLLSTGTWCISLNPFNDSELTLRELEQDCLCYLTYEGNPVKAARLFAGYDHEQQLKRIAAHFHTSLDAYKNVTMQHLMLGGRSEEEIVKTLKHDWKNNFADRDLASLENFEQAYCALMVNIASRQVESTNLVLTNKSLKNLFVDGGFSKNPLYMGLLSLAYPSLNVASASVPQATALGAALVLHDRWNRQPFPKNLIALSPVRATHNQD